MAQVVPIFDWFEDFFAPVAAQHAMVQRYPDRVLFCGGADPVYRGLADALDQIDHQVRDLGACSMKFYTATPTARGAATTSSSPTPCTSAAGSSA